MSPEDVNGSIAPIRAGFTAADISYAAVASSRGAQFVIRAVETLTGRPRLKRLARGYERDVVAGRDFWTVMQDRYRIRLEFVGGGPENIPPAGPVVLVANHPYGILDGLALGRILSLARPDFCIVAYAVFQKAKELNDVILPIEFGASKRAAAVNIATRNKALAYLAQGGAIGIFPAGMVSTAARPFSRARDPVWKPFTAKMIARSGAAVVPVHFDGANSRLFQIASHINATLRTALLIGEFHSRVGDSLRVTVGRPLPAGEIARRACDGRALMDYLRRETYGLSPDCRNDCSYGLQLA